jgi:hypothetical protein
VSTTSDSLSVAFAVWNLSFDIATYDRCGAAGAIRSFDLPCGNFKANLNSVNNAKIERKSLSAASQFRSWFLRGAEVSEDDIPKANRNFRGNFAPSNRR